MCYVYVSSAAPYCMCIPFLVYSGLAHGPCAAITLRKSLGHIDITCVMSVSKFTLPFVVSYDFLGLKIGNSFLIICSLLHVYEQTGSVIHC